MQSLPSFLFSQRSCRPVLAAFAVLIFPLWAPADAAQTGKQIYKSQCASCHGASGEGTEDYPRPLAGHRSLAQLTRLIHKRMPKGEPEKCEDKDAEIVSAYIYDTFYSKDAQERNKPPRIALARLTVRQHQNALADLIGGFRSRGTWGEKRGLRGEYSPSRRFRRRGIQRLDARVQFDFKMGSPHPKLKANEFGIRWSGAVWAPETGIYDFIIRTKNGARLWVNDRSRPLIDAWVRSGTDIEQRAPLFLLGGRAYPIRLEMFKSRKAKEKTAAITLAWKPPHGADEPIPTQHLSPNWHPEIFVCKTLFPPDDRSLGWVRGTTISKAWDAATTDAALEVGRYVTSHLGELAGTQRGQSINESQVRTFLTRFAERAFGRPLTAEQRQFFVDRHFIGRKMEPAVKRAVLLILKSPRFLYPELGSGEDGYRVASRLALSLWDSLPNQELLSLAPRLTTREQVAQQAEQMLTDPRAHEKLREFYLEWLGVNEGAEIAKDPKHYPQFKPEVIADLRISLKLFLDEVTWSKDSDFRQFFLADHLYVNDRLARFYGIEQDVGKGFQKVVLKEGKRAGVLTHPYLMSKFAYTGSSSPIHRGVFIARGVLGLTLQPPPQAFTPLPADLHPRLTTRERVALQTRETSCQVCHGVINPLGFTLENFDAVGRFRARDNNKPVDASGTYETRAGKVMKFSGPQELARFLASSEEVQEAFIEHLFHHLVKQPVRAYGPDQLVDLRKAFSIHDFNIRKLAVEIVTVTALADHKGASSARGASDSR